MDSVLSDQAPESLEVAATAFQDFEIAAISDVPRTEVIDVLNRSLNTRHGEAWFAWKHVDNPFGPSLGWVAVGNDGLLGVRLLMRWQLRLGERILSVVRPVDTATAAHARRKGVFRALTRRAVAAVSEDAGLAFIFNTPNTGSCAGYARMGWSLLPPLRHGIWPVWPGPAAQLATDDSVFDAFERSNLEPDRMRTRRDPMVMRWRYSLASGTSYGIARLRQANTANGIIYGVNTRRGFRVLRVQELVGTPQERRQLLSSVARREHARAVIAATGPGASQLVQGYPVRRGYSQLAVRQLAGAPLDASKLDSWALTLGDLEGTI